MGGQLPGTLFIFFSLLLHPLLEVDRWAGYSISLSVLSFSATRPSYVFHFHIFQSEFHPQGQAPCFFCPSFFITFPHETSISNPGPLFPGQFSTHHFGFLPVRPSVFSSNPKSVHPNSLPGPFCLRLSSCNWWMSTLRSSCEPWHWNKGQ